MGKNGLIKIFKEYVSDFDVNDEAINRKYNHSLRVMDLSIKIANYLKLNDEEIYLASIIGLLHDYARFPQWQKYKTFNDIKSIDHGDFGVELLFDNNEIERFNIDKKYYDIIYNAIKNHNKLSIPDNLSKQSELFSKIIRDADKLDIFYIFGANTFFIKQDDSEISSSFINKFYNNILLSYKDINTTNDKILLDLSMIYDFNFNYSYLHLKNNKLIDKFYDNINDKQKFKEYFDYIINYINERID